MSIYRRLRGLAQQFPTDIQVGKNGLSERVLAEIKRRLKKKGIVKVRLLNSSLEVEGKNRRELAAEISKYVDGVLIDVRGKTLIIVRKDISPARLLRELESKVLKV